MIGCARRRELNQAVFEHLYIHDDEIIASDLEPAFRRLMSDSLASDLERERKRDQNTLVRTKDLWTAPEVGDTPDRGEEIPCQDLPARARRTPPEARQRAFLGLERPRGALPWENKEPRPLKDRGSNEILLVAATRIELVTLGL